MIFRIAPIMGIAPAFARSNLMEEMRQTTHEECNPQKRDPANKYAITAPRSAIRAIASRGA
jgi:hypothetical protein